MLNLINQAKLRLKTKLYDDGDVIYQQLADDILSANTVSKLQVQKIAELSLFERWLLLSEILKIKPLKAFHFLHVPKTGGTTFGETLGKDKKALIVSVDAEPKTLLMQLRRLANAKPDDIVLSRAHHSLKLIVESKCVDHYSIILTAYRDPIAIHVSNVNMIMRRLVDFFDEKPMPDAEQKFCQEWAKVIGYNFENSVEFANKLVSSNDYLTQMGEIYGRFFNVKNWQTMVKQRKLVVISSDSFDQMFTDVFDYKNIPERKNVSLMPLLTPDMLTAQSKALLIGKDKIIADFLSQNLCTPASIKPFFIY